MRTESLEWLTCPGKDCEGSLSPGSAIPVVLSDSDPGDLLEGVLKCGECAAEYPVILGVALLENDLQSYLWTFWSEVESCAGETPATISRSMRAYLGVPSAFTGQPGPRPESHRNLEWTTSPYLQAHFDSRSLGEGLPPGWWRDAVETHRLAGTDPYTYLMEEVRKLPPQRRAGLAIDVGTSVGRGSVALAGCYRYSVGVDRSFRAILAARRLLLGQPAQMDFYRIQTERGTWAPRKLPLQQEIGNLDFVVASGAALPVPSGSASCVAALNVLCTVSEPLPILDEFSRILLAGGALLLSSPYWSEEGEAAGSPALEEPEFLRDAVSRKFDIVAERDMVPWLMRLAKRRWNVYLCHCVVATKR